MRIHHLLLVITFLVIFGQIIGQSTKLPDYKNPDKDIKKRVEDLLSRMTLEEKINMVSGAKNDDIDSDTDSKFAACCRISKNQSRRGSGYCFFLSGGNYRLTEPLELGINDGGTAEAPVHWKAMPGEKPIINGGISVRKWKQEDDGSWSALLPTDFHGEFRSFYVNNKRAIRARFPDNNFFGPTHRLWQPVPDEIYLQELGQKIPLGKPATSIAEFNNQCYVVVEGNIHWLSNESVNPVISGPVNVKQLKSLNGTLWALSSNGIYSLEENEWQKIDDREFVDICMHLGVLHAATREEVYRLEDNKFIDIKPEAGYLSSDITMLMEDGSQVLADPVRIGPIDRIASFSGTLYILRPGGELVLFDGKIVNQDFVDWGTLPSPNTKDLLSFGSRLFISTNRGLGVLRGAAITSLKGKDGLPFEETTCLEAGFENDIWIGTTKGAIRMLKDDWHYFGADHWLPGDNVHDIAVGDNVVYIATDHGIGIIRYEPYTLRKKADYYERHLDEWGHKRLGFIHTLYKKGDEWIREVSDNDGGHTAPYLAAMSYKYAVTGDKTARHEAVESFKAMLWLEEVTTVDGLVARSIWSTTADADTRGRHGSGGLPAKWYPTKDGKWYWKGDTSSDEIIAHFYSVP